MNDTLYSLINWSAVEALVYSEHDNPHSWLGVHPTEFGVLYNAYLPTAEKVFLRLASSREDIPMEPIDEEGNFSVLVQAKEGEDYCFVVTYIGGTTVVLHDSYAYEPVISHEDERRFLSGIHYEIYEKLGAHKISINGITGVHFAVWAPNAQRVSVVGNFNLWDGRRHQMRKLKTTGIFEIFIPDIDIGELYKFELKMRSGLVYLKSDPYAFYSELRPYTASIVTELDGYNWSDERWLRERKEKNLRKEPLLIYEVHLGSWKKPTEENGSFYNYRELAVMIAKYVKDMGYTHIELMPVMEHPYDGSWGYQVSGYYSITSRYGTPEDFMFFVDYMHRQEIGVILDWVPAHFPRDTFALSRFDGTCLYEHPDPRRGEHPHWGTLIFNFGRPEVSNFLIAGALFWVEKYHADGIRMDAVASMLYLDYGREDGNWQANIYGGNENLEAVEMLKHLNSIFHKKTEGAFLVAEESTAWPMVTGDVEENGLGFDYKWNMGWMNDFLGYIRQDPLFRKGMHGALTFGMIYAYSENFILVFSHDEVVHGKGSMINKMPGELEDKFANLRIAYGFMMSHPGKKLLFMGQDFAQFKEWNEEYSLSWELLYEPLNKCMNRYVKDLNHLYTGNKALYELDFNTEGFKWLSCLDADRSTLSFIRKAEDGTMLVFVFNYTPVLYTNFLLGVPKVGKYKEILNSDRECYGGKGNLNPRVKQSGKIPSDGFENSINITLPPLGMCVFLYCDI